MDSFQIVLSLVAISIIIYTVIQHIAKREQEIVVCRYCCRVSLTRSHYCVSMKLFGIKKSQTASLENTKHFVSVDIAENTEDWRLSPRILGKKKLA